MKNILKVSFVSLTTFILVIISFPVSAEAAMSCSTSGITVTITSSGCSAGSQFLYRNSQFIGAIGCNASFYDTPPYGTFSYSSSFGNCSVTVSPPPAPKINITVSPTIPLAGWNLYGSGDTTSGITFSGSGPTLIPSQPAGQYTIIWYTVSGYTTPPSQTQSSSSNITFTGNYTSSCSNDCSPSGSSCNGSYARTCADYDADPCLEWSAQTYCSYGCSSGSCLPPPANRDIGLRLFDGSQTIRIAIEPLGTLTSPLRIAKNGIIYGIVLVDTTDANASKMRVRTNSGTKAIRKY